MNHFEPSQGKRLGTQQTAQEGLPNLLDKGVLRVGRERGLEAVVQREWEYVDEIPFDFERRLLSVVLRPIGMPTEELTLICKVQSFCKDGR